MTRNVPKPLNPPRRPKPTVTQGGFNPNLRAPLPKMHSGKSKSPKTNITVKRVKG